MRRWLTFVAASCLVVVLLAGCGGDGGEPKSPTATPVVIPTEIPTPSVPVPVGEVVWTLLTDDATGEPIDPLTTLPNSAARVFAVVHADELPAGTRIVARWSIDGAPLPELDPAPVVINASRVDAWVSWSLTWTSEQPWPIATLGIEIEVNGEIMSKGEILIVRDRPTDEG